MAEGQGFQAHGEIFVGERARTMLNAIAYFENEWGQGRAGRGPYNNNNNRGVTRQEMGLQQGRAHPLNTLRPGLGSLSSWRGRGRGHSLPTPTTSPSTPP